MDVVPEPAECLWAWSSVELGSLAWGDLQEGALGLHRDQGWQHLGKPSLGMAKQEKPKHRELSVVDWFWFWISSVSGLFQFLDCFSFWIVSVSGSVLFPDPWFSFWIISVSGLVLFLDHFSF